MLKLNPVKSEKIWGYELWIASTHPNGPQREFVQACGGEYPLLVKIIQANDTLSIQVHPDDADAVRLEGQGNRGKTECWYVLDAAPDAKLVYGLKEGASREQLASAIENSALDPYLNFVNVQKGDFIYIPAGTVHAIGGGLRLLEVQQSCDLTYRLYDWGRGREVHIQKGLDVIKTKDMIAPAPFSGEFECPYFSLERKDICGGWSMYNSGEKNDPAAVQLIYVLSEDKAVIRGPEDKVGRKIQAEEIYAVLPGEKITIEGKALVIRIKSK
ncbi:MAG: class I mannose-6-phosphate isomerase [Treponema sp.]|nr:class I mannose-6-phosphate isomerase [Treponema sp.]